MISQIRINQTGYYPAAPKIFIIADINAGQEIVYSGKLIDKGLWINSGEHVEMGDFSALKTSGRYQVEISGEKSYPFEIKKNIFKQVLQGSLKLFYYQRASFEFVEKYAGKWQRPAGHLDDCCLLHESTYKSGIIPSPACWSDTENLAFYYNLKNHLLTDCVKTLYFWKMENLFPIFVCYFAIFRECS